MNCPYILYFALAVHSFAFHKSFGDLLGARLAFGEAHHHKAPRIKQHPTSSDVSLGGSGCVLGCGSFNDHLRTQSYNRAERVTHPEEQRNLAILAQDPIEPTAQLCAQEKDVPFREASASPERSIIEPPHAPRTPCEEIEFDAQVDLRYSHKVQKFARVAHIFHQSWHGIRSAAGTLPGHKIAIPHIELCHEHFENIVSQLATWNVEKAVFHGFSVEAEKILEHVSAAGVQCYLVWHGNLAQLVWEPEGQYFASAMRACQRGVFRRAHMLKFGMGDVFPNSYEPILLNSPPKTNKHRISPAFGGKSRRVLVPAFPDIRKNLHTNLVGAALSRLIDEVLYYARVQTIVPLTEKCTRIDYFGHDKHVEFLHLVDATINVTLIDCHPMVDLEALGAGAFALTGRLFLDALENHPFSKLSQIENPFDARGIGARLEYICAMNNIELQCVMEDYVEKLTQLSQDRYAEFLNL